MTKSVSFFTRQGYGQFPYIIIREQAGIYRQIPIHFSKDELKSKEGIYVKVTSKDSHEIIESKCVESLKQILMGELKPISKSTPKPTWVFIGQQAKQGCLVLNPGQAIYLNSKGNVINVSADIPSGGTLLSVSGFTILQNEKHFNYEKIDQ